MSLNTQIKNDIKEAMRAKEIVKRDTLRNIQASIKQIEVDERREVTDSDVEAVLMKYMKQREDAKAQFAEAGRNDLVEKEDAEMAIVTVMPSDMPPVKYDGRIWVRTGPRRSIANEQEERIFIEFDNTWEARF